MGRPLIIALVGIDGAGKTTQARWLAGWLSAHGVPAAYFMNPGGRPTLARLARRLGRADGVDLLGPRTYLAVEAAVRWAAIARALITARLTRRVAVMDRYTYCQYAVVRVRGDRGQRLVRRMFAPFPGPDLVCFLSVEPRQAERRVSDRGTDQEELAYLHALDAAYRDLPEHDRFHVIDAGGEQAAVRAALIDAVTHTLGVTTGCPGPRNPTAGP